ncbi:MAG TPA: acetyl-CoA C-acetyltransferase [Actinomycetota bacterium]|jgi:acetyl-CoA C-acetyltransferase|nr:acetyl-CoA C-acetyltransferase [Actinomycetota bacterium]
MRSSVIVSGARTPIGKFRGAFADRSAVDLGAIAIRAALERSGVSPDQADYVVMGHVIRAGTGQITARQAAIAAGIPKEVPALNVDKVCLSGTTAIALADQMIRAGEVEIVVAGGMESMTQAPYVLPKARAGSRLGDAEMIDTMIHDGLWSTFTKQTMGESSDAVNAELGIGRAEQDAWSARSHRRAHAGWESGALAEEVVPVEVTSKGRAIVIERDEGIRPDSTAEGLARLRPAFVKNGTITAGNASQISDGAAAVVVTSLETAQRLGLNPLAEIVAHGMSAERFPYLHTVPALALQNALKKADLDVHDLGLLEVNEAFAAVSLNVTRILGFDEGLVNVNGGAVALGHPIGASGARIVLTLAHEMRRRGVDLGGAAICGGGGQGDALVIRRVTR